MKWRIKEGIKEIKNTKIILAKRGWTLIVLP